MKQYLIGLALASTLVVSIFPMSIAHAQNLDIASTYQIADSAAITGDIMTSKTGTGIVRSETENDSRMFGVIQDNPVMVFRNINAQATEKAITRSGDSPVNVTDVNGEIQPGDFVTSSKIAGKGMKGVNSGYVLGVATSKFQATGEVDFEGKKLKTGTVNVAIRIEYFELNSSRDTNRFLNSLNTAFFNNIQDPNRFTEVIRYILAGVVALIFLFISFLGFTRSVTKGIEAIGRNPLAKRAIQISILLNLGMSIVVSAIGLAIVYLILYI